jgi:hypothetical protein
MTSHVRLHAVYDNSKARRELGWLPAYTFDTAVDMAARQLPIQSPLATAVGIKGYHTLHRALGEGTNDGMKA